MSAAPLRVLVIDDEPPIRKLLRVGLSAHGYQTVEASSGRSALELLREQPPDLVILDLGLPDMQGHELLRTMRARNAKRCGVVEVTRQIAPAHSMRPGGAETSAPAEQPTWHPRPTREE